jgi:flagellar hook-associated protein 2
MGGISSGTGLFSGIDSRSLIDQLLAIDARPKQIIQRRGVQIQQLSAVFLDLNSRVNALRTASSSFRTGDIFKAMGAASSDDKILTATASNTAAAGSYSFVVDRLVSTQQLLSRGFADRNQSAVGAGNITVESERANLERDISLADLNGGEGVRRGKIVITDSANRSVTVDLSKAATVNDVLEAINANGTANVTASVRDGRFIIRDNAGGTVRVDNATGSTTAASLGIAGSAAGQITGSNVYSLTGRTTLAQLNDGNGVAIKRAVGTGVSQFSITVDRGGTQTTVAVNLGDVYTNNNGTLEVTQGAVSTVEGALKRINDALTAAGLSDVSAAVSSDGQRLAITDNNGSPGSITVADTDGGTTARDLGITGSGSDGSLDGRRILSGLNTTLARSLNGGQGIAGNGTLNFTLRNGATFNASVNTDGSLAEIAKQIEDASALSGNARVRVAINSKGTGLQITDLTNGTSSNLIIQGTSGQDTAASLGISTGATGVASNTVTGTNLQKQYISRASALSSISNGQPVGTGEFRITDGYGASAVVNVTNDDKTLGDLIDKINSRGLKILARVNANGDGIEIVEDPQGGPVGGTAIRIQDSGGSVARRLNLAGDAAGTGAQNKINGSFERTINIAATDTLDQITTKVNQANVGVSAVVIRDGSGATPFKLSLTATGSGSAGRVIVDSGSFDLGLSTISRGQDARVLFGGTDPTTAVLLTSTTNRLDDVVAGVQIDLKSAGTDPVTLNVSRNVGSVEASVENFVKAFNDLVGRIDSQSKYDEKTNRGGPLLGESTSQSLRQELFRTIQGTSIGNTGTFSRLAQVGVTVAEGGKIELDKERLRAAIAEDAGSVEALFAGRTLAARDSDPNNDATERQGFTLLGVVGRVEELANRYSNTADGIITARTRSFESQTRNLTQRLEAMDTRLASRRINLERQFLAMEQAIAKMQSQGNFLSSALG